MRRDLFEPYRALQNHGVEVTKRRIPPMNAGGKSETTKHHVAKNLVAFVAAQEWGYMTDIEVTVPNGDIDCLLWGHSERLTYAVECETSPTEETKEEKLQKYVKEIPPIDDMVLINLSEMPLDMIEAKDYIQDQL